KKRDASTAGHTATIPNFFCQRPASAGRSTRPSQEGFLACPVPGYGRYAANVEGEYPPYGCRHHDPLRSGGRSPSPGGRDLRFDRPIWPEDAVTRLQLSRRGDGLAARVAVLCAGLMVAALVVGAVG